MKIKYPLFRKFEIWYVDTIAFFKVARKKDWINKFIREWSSPDNIRIVYVCVIVFVIGVICYCAHNSAHMITEVK